MYSVFLKVVFLVVCGYEGAFAVLDPRVECNESVADCRFVVRSSGYISSFELVDFVKETLESKDQKGRDIYDILNDPKDKVKLESVPGLNYVSFWAQDEEVRETIAAALIYQNDFLEEQRGQAYKLKFLVYAIRSRDFSKFQFGIDGSTSVDGSSRPGTDTAIFPAVPGSLTGFAPSLSFAVLRFKLDAGVGSNLAEDSKSTVVTPRNGEFFNVSDLTPVYIASNIQTFEGAAGLSISGKFSRHGSDYSRFYISEGQVTHGLTPNDPKNPTNNLEAQVPNQQLGVTSQRVELKSEEFQLGQPTVIFDQTILSSEGSGQVGFFNSSNSKEEKFRLLIFMTIFDDETLQNQEKEYKRLMGVSALDVENNGFRNEVKKPKSYSPHESGVLGRPEI